MLLAIERPTPLGFRATATAFPVAKAKLVATQPANDGVSDSGTSDSDRGLEPLWIFRAVSCGLRLRRRRLCN
jgi:hypothetical protein